MIGSWRITTPFFISSKLEFLGVEGVTDFVGILMAVGSLILGPFIIRFEMQFLPLSLGKLRFLKGWLFFFYVDSSPWSDLTLDNLMRRGCPLANCCCLCCSNAESVDHLLLFCPIILCRCICFGCLGSNGSCQVQLWTYHFAGTIGLGSIALIFGIWFQVV